MVIGWIELTLESLGICSTLVIVGASAPFVVVVGTRNCEVLSERQAESEPYLPWLYEYDTWLGADVSNLLGIRGLSLVRQVALINAVLGKIKDIQKALSHWASRSCIPAIKAVEHVSIFLVIGPFDCLPPE